MCYNGSRSGSLAWSTTFSFVWGAGWPLGALHDPLGQGALAWSQLVHEFAEGTQALRYDPICGMMVHNTKRRTLIALVVDQRRAI